MRETQITPCWFFCSIAVQTVVHFVPWLPGLDNTFWKRYTRYGWGMAQWGSILRFSQLHPRSKNWPIRSKYRPQTGFKLEKRNLHMLQRLRPFVPRPLSNIKQRVWLQTRLGVCFKVIVKTGGAEGKVLHVAIWERGPPFQDMWA